MINDIEQLDPAAVSYIVECLSALRTIDQVQKDFEKFSAQRISGAVIQKIRLKYADRIKRQTEIYLKNVDAEPLKHDRILYSILNRIVDECMIPRATHAVKNGDDWLPVEKCDFANAINAVKLAHVIKKDAEDLEVKKNNGSSGMPPEQANEGWEIFDGIRRVQ